MRLLETACEDNKNENGCMDGVTCVVLYTLPSIYLVCVFGNAIPISFYILGKCFSYLAVYIVSDLL